VAQRGDQTRGRRGPAVQQTCLCKVQGARCDAQDSEARGVGVLCGEEGVGECGERGGGKGAWDEEDVKLGCVGEGVLLECQVGWSLWLSWRDGERVG
jgi:hypothetical protein